MIKFELIKSDLKKLLYSDLFINIIILLIINIILLFDIISKNGIILQVDFNFPIFDGNFIDYSTYMWYDFNSQPNIEQIMRLFIRLPYIFLAYLGVDVGIILRIMVLVTYTFVSISTFIFINEILKRMEIKNRFIALAGSLMFAYNPVMLQFGWKISIPFSIGVLPLILFLILRYQETNSKKFIILFPILLLFSLGHPFTLIMNLLIPFLFSVFIYSQRIFSTIKKYCLITILFSLMFSWFIIPYMLIGLTSADLGRSANLEQAVFENTFDNQAFRVLILERENLLDVKTFPTDELNKMIHTIALIVLLGISIIIPLWEIKSIQSTINIRIIFFAIFGYIITVLFSLGSDSPIKEIYWYLISSTPIGWIIRSPLKFQLFQSFFLIILFIIGISILIKKNKLNNYVYVLMVLSIFIGMSGYGIIDINNKLKPIQIPQQFFEINDILKGKNDNYKVMWYPRYNSIETNWSEGHRILAFDQKSSRKPTFATEWNYNFVKYNLDTILYTSDISEKERYYDFLLAIGVKYIAFHNDRNKEIDSIILRNIYNHSDNIYNKGDWYLFELKGVPANYIYAWQNVILTENIFENPGGKNASINTREINKENISDIDVMLNNYSGYAIINSYEKIEPASWEVMINSSKPFLLSFSETYDPLWEAVIYKDNKEIKKIEPIRIFSTINGFWIDETGSLKITIKYKLQYLFKSLLLISVFMLAVCAGFMFYDRRGNKNRMLSNGLNYLKIPPIGIKSPRLFKPEFKKNTINSIAVLIGFIVIYALFYYLFPVSNTGNDNISDNISNNISYETDSPELIPSQPVFQTNNTPISSVTPEIPVVVRASNLTPAIIKSKNYSIKMDIGHGFYPDIIAINKSDSIIWINEEYQPSKIVLLSEDGLFANNILEYADRYQYQFNQQGNYTFKIAEYPSYAEYPNATGRVIVN